MWKLWKSDKPKKEHHYSYTVKIPPATIQLDIFWQISQKSIIVVANGLRTARSGSFCQYLPKKKILQGYYTIDYCLDFPDKWEFNEAKLPIKLLWWTFVSVDCVLKWILVDISCEKMEQHILYLNSSFQILVDAWK